MPDADPNVDSDEKDAENAAAGARARACRASSSESGRGEDADPLTELERIAKEIETGTPRVRETARDILGQYPGVKRAALAALVRNLGARKFWFSAKKKERVFEPNFDLQFKAAELLLDRADGRPAAAVLNLNANVDTLPSKDPEANPSPMMIVAMERWLERAKEKLAGVQKRPRDVVATPA
jgi:hypothetical protein